VSDYEFSKSTYSSGDAHGECVEVARNNPRTIAVRDSKVLDGPMLQVVPRTWATFIRSLHRARS